MPSPNVRIPTWATDPAVVGGTEDGQPVRVEPSAPIKGQGYKADQPIAARYDNWRAGATGDWLTYLAPILLRNWELVLSEGEIGGITAPILAPGMAVIERQVRLLGSDNNSDGYAAHITPQGPRSSGVLVRSVGNVSEFSQLVSIATNGTAWIAGGRNNTTATDTRLVKGTEATWPAWDPEVLSATLGTAAKVIWTGSQFVAFHPTLWQDGVKYYTSSDADTWTERTVNSSAAAKNFGWPVVNPSGQLALYFTNENTVLFSDDHGLTWLATYPAGSEGLTGLCWTVRGWTAVSRTGNVYWYTGGAWVTLDGGLDYAFDSGQQTTSAGKYFGNQIASDGGRFCVVPAESPSRGLGVYWSIDCGETWTLDWLSASGHDTYPPSVRGGVSYQDSRFWLICEVVNAAGSGTAYNVFRSIRL